MKPLILTLLCLAPLVGIARNQHIPHSATLAALLSEPNQDDPGYVTYRRGYELILGERWEDARRELAEVAAKHPKSDYVDDAAYWRAYALKHIDRTQAVDAYMRFIEQYPKSNYYDDAVADLAALKANVVVVSTSDTGIVFISPNGRSYGYGAGNPPLSEAPSDLNFQLIELEDALRHHEWHMQSLELPEIGHMDFLRRGNEKLDPRVRLRIDALRATARSNKDEKAFNTVKAIALDRKEEWPVRRSAISLLSNFRKFDTLPVYVELAKTDTSTQVQNTAIASIRRIRADKEKAVNALIGLFPTTRAPQSRTVLYSIAELGTDRAVDFLARVARTHENFDLRSDAVYLLGNIGTEKARTAIYEILTGK